MVRKQEGKRRRWLYYGCLVLLVLLLLAVAAAALLLWKAQNMCLRLTDARPTPLPEVVLPALEYDALQKKVEAFMEAARQGTAHEPLVLTGQEANALIAQNAGLKSLKGKVYVTFLSNRLQVNVSMPLKTVPLRAFQERYLNGTGLFNATLQNGVLIVCAEALWIKGQKMPTEIMDRIKKENLAKEVYKDVDTARMLSRVKCLEIQDGRLEVELFPPQAS